MARQSVFLCFLLITESIYGQRTPRLLHHQSALSDAGEFHSKIQVLQQQAGHCMNLLVARDGQMQVDAVNLTEVLSVIVEFKEPPLFLQQTTPRQVAAPISFFASRFRRFVEDVQKIHQSHQSRLQVQLGAWQIEQEFYKVFFGVSLKVSRMALQQIQHLDYVKKIHLDRQIAAFLDESVPLIRADSVWYKYRTQGDSVVVGILDTGIDYRHPALGGGLGAGFKVIGGYDLINKDADPMDDNGHGTFVAGIVAGDGDSIKGVAPKALLMGFKVLDKNGFGEESQIIAGIERAVDPNDDKDPADKVDIANMSLSTVAPGNPDDALATATNNAVKLGVTFCVAAGNNYRFKTIGSPGTAALAITVGATDKNDHMAEFSSKGPNRKTFSIKPEIVAPGVDIRSLSLNGSFITASGTSNSAPHVAGVCALLKAVHPEWAPTQIKSALMTSALDLGEEVMVQGVGRLEALNAAATEVFVHPAHLSFGLDDVTMAEWTKRDTLKVINRSASVQSFDISFEGLQAGIQLTATPTSFALAEGDTQSIVVTLNVINELVAYPQEGSLAYSGQMSITGTKNQLRLPWAFVKAAKVILTFDEPFPRFYLISHNNVNTPLDNDVEMIDPYTFETVAAGGRYDLVTLFLGGDNKVVIEENLVIEGYLTLAVNSLAATHRIDLNGVDEQGRLLSSLPNATNHYFLFFPDSSRSLYWGLLGYPNQLLFSDFSERFTLFAGEHQDGLIDEASVRNVQHQPIVGLKQNMILANAPSDFVMQNLRMQYPPNSSYRDIRFAPGIGGAIIRGSAWFFFQDAGNLNPIRVSAKEWQGKVYQTPDVIKGFRFGVGGVARDVPLSSDTIMEEWIGTGSFGTVGDSMGIFFPRSTAKTYLSPNGGEMTFGAAPIYGNLFYSNNQLSPSNIAARVDFYGAFNELRQADISRSRYNVYDEQNNLMISGELDEYAPYFNIPPLNVQPGRYRLEVPNTNYFVEGVRGNAILTTEFDLRESDPDPAFFTSLKLLNARGLPVSRLATGASAKLLFSTADVFVTKHNDGLIASYRSIAVDSTKFYFKQRGTSSWQEVNATPVVEDTTLAYMFVRLVTGHLFTADLSHTTNFDSTAIDLKISVQDQSGNRTEWTLEPAYAVGKFGIVVSVEEEPQESPALPRAYKLYPSHPNPFFGANGVGAVIHFDLPRTEKVTVKIYDVLGREVDTLLDKVVAAGKHRVTWNGTNQDRAPLANGVYICKLRASGFEASTKLLLLRQK